jgi:hypothetical protein
MIVTLNRQHCAFYLNTGACRFGDKCVMPHVKPIMSPTLLIPKMYENSASEIAMAEGLEMPEEQMAKEIKKFREFYSIAFLFLAKFGHIKEL